MPRRNDIGNETLEQDFARRREEIEWRQRWRGSDRDSEKALKAWEEIQNRYRRRPEHGDWVDRTPGALPRSRVRVAEADAPRGGSGGPSVPVNREVIEAVGQEVRRFNITTGEHVSTDIEWQGFRWRDVNGNEWDEDLNLTNRTEDITPAP